MRRKSPELSSTIVNTQKIECNDGLDEYVDSLSDDSVARWYALMIGESFVAKKCGDDEDCISSHSNALCKYINEIWEDVKFYLDKIKNGDGLKNEEMDATYRELAGMLGLLD